MVRRLAIAACLVVLLATTAAAQVPPKKWGWAVTPSVPERLRPALLTCAPEALQAAGKFALTVHEKPVNAPEFAALLREQGLEQGALVDHTSLGDGERLTIWLVDATGEIVAHRGGNLGGDWQRPCDQASRLAWKLTERPLPPAAIKMRDQARVAAKAGRYEEADEYYRRVIIIAYHAGGACREAGRMWQRAGRNDVALVWYDHALQRDGFDYATLLWMAQLYKGDDDDEQARRTYERALEVGPRGPALLFTVARHYAETGRIRQAQELLVEAFERDPTDVIPAFRLWEVAERNHDPATAASAIERMLALGSGDDSHRRLLATYQLAAGNFPAAETTIRDLRTRHPGDAELFQDYVRLLVETGRDDEATPLLRQALIADPDAVWALFALGQVHYRARRYADALPLLERTLALASGDEGAEQLLAKVVELTGDKARALSLYEQRLLRGDINADSLNRYVNLAASEGETARAVLLLKRLRKNTRRTPNRQAIVAALAKLFEREGRLAEAVLLYRDQTRRGGADAQLLLELARLEFAAGDGGGAAADLRRVGYSTTEPGLLISAARLAARHDDHELAAELYGRAYRTDPSATLAGVLYLESLLLRGPNEETATLLFELHNAISDPDQRELLSWLELFHYAESSGIPRFDELLPFVLRGIAAREQTRVDVSRWSEAIEARLAEPRLSEMRDLLAVFARTLTPAKFAAKHHRKIDGL